ncbi:polysaccharide lyase family 7 protein [Pseudarthrobacter phenanthrenivorans]
MFPRSFRAGCVVVIILTSLSACSTQPDPDKPASVLNLDNWKLSVPVVSNSDGHPSEILQPELRHYSSKYLSVAPGRKEVIFQTPAQSAIQPGSEFPRTELREMTDGGQQEAKWSTRTGTHQLVVEQAVTALPTTTPDVIVGQIHNADEFVLIVRLDGKHLYSRTQDGKTDTLNDNYNLKTFFTLKILATEGSISVYYNDELKASHKKNCSSCYFKAGMYLQTNTDSGESPDSIGEVHIRSLEVSHH